MIWGALTMASGQRGGSDHRGHLRADQWPSATRVTKRKIFGVLDVPEMAGSGGDELWHSCRVIPRKGFRGAIAPDQKDVVGFAFALRPHPG